MTVAQLKSPSGDIIGEFELPRSLSEVRLNRYVDFLIESFNMAEGNAVAGLIKAVNAFYGISVDELAGIATGNLYDDSHGFEGTLRSLYGWAVTLIEKFEPQLATLQEHQFSYNGRTFEMPVIVQAAARGEQILPSLSVIEAVEAAEVQRRIMQAIDDNRAARRKMMKDAGADIDGAEMIVAAAKIDIEKGVFVETQKYRDALHLVRNVQQAGDPNGSQMYSQFLQMLAVLYRERIDENTVESLPIDDGQREGFIQNRAAFFANIDAATALNCAFFLKNILTGYEGYASVVSFLTLLNFEVLAATLLRKGKRTTGRKGTTKPYFAASVGGN